MVGVVMIGSGVVNGFGLLKIRIFGYCGIWISYDVVTLAFSLVAINYTVVEILR